MISLRPRQKKFYEDIRKAAEKGSKRILCQAPCGFGKTPTMVTIIKEAEKKNKKIIFIAPRKELIGQCSKMLTNWQIEHGVLNNKHKLNYAAKVQLTCWQKLHRSKNEFKPDLILYDEAHGSVSEKAIEVMKRYENSMLLGFTATPYRDDGLGLKELYDVLVESCSTEDLINDGLLIKPTYKVCGDVTTTQAITSNTIEELIESIEADILIKADLIRNFKNICPTAKTCVFCPTIERAEEIAKKFENSGFSARSVDCRTPDKEREKILNDFANGKFQIICNASLLKEGWDYPDLECVILLRNLNSRVFYRQACGRCMRTSKTNPNKEAYVLDFFNCVEKFGVPWETEIYSLTETVQRINKEIDKNKEKENDPLFCAKCRYNLEESDNGICPLCKTKIEKRNKIIAEAIADLVTIDDNNKPPSMCEKQEKYNELAAQCIQRNRKPGWVSHTYKNIFGVWPRKMLKTEAFEKYCEEYEKKENERKGQILLSV